MRTRGTSRADLSAEYNVYTNDIPENVWTRFSEASQLAWDIETSGLDWRTERIATCQLFCAGVPPVIVRIGSQTPTRLVELLENSNIQKVFHHAMFDLRFMAHAWDASPQNIACTKIAAKLLDVHNQYPTTLKALTAKYLGVSIDKSERLSDWLSHELTSSQLSYAIADVIYLLKLFGALEQDLLVHDLLPLALACYSHIPARVQLDVMGYQDVYAY